jgi:hypothetical protein
MCLIRVFIPENDNVFVKYKVKKCYSLRKSVFNKFFTGKNVYNVNIRG